MGHNYAVFGAGRQGTAVIYDLIENCEADSVFVYDVNLSQLDNLKEKLRLPYQADKIVCFDDYERMWKNINPHTVDIILGCAPAEQNVELTKKAIRHNVPFCDLGGVPEVVAKQKELSKDKDILIIPDCGLAPGIANMVCAHFARKYKCQDIIMRCGGIPAEYHGGAFNYKISWLPEGLISEYSGDCAYISNGQICYANACTDTQDFEDKYECFYTSNNSYECMKSLLNAGVKNLDYKTLRYKGHMSHIQSWKMWGYLKGNYEKDKELVKMLNENEDLKYKHNENDLIILYIKGTYTDEYGVAHSHTYDIRVEGTRRFKAMELITSWGITTVAYYMAMNKTWFSRFMMPSDIDDIEWFINQFFMRLNNI